QRGRGFLGGQAQVLGAGLVLADDQRQRRETHDLLDGFPAQPRIQAVEPGQFLGAKDLHLVRIDRVEVAGQRWTSRKRVSGFQAPRRALLPRGPAQLEAFALLFEQLAGGDRVVHAASSRSSRERSASGPGAARSASRLPGTAKYSASSDNSCRCCWVKCSGTAMANTRSTGWPSPAWKDTGRRSRRKAARTSAVVLQRPWGIATPWPIAVLPNRSRWCSATAMDASSAGAP